MKCPAKVRVLLNNLRSTLRRDGWRDPAHGGAQVMRRRRQVDGEKRWEAQKCSRAVLRSRSASLLGVEALCRRGQAHPAVRNLGEMRPEWHLNVMPEKALN